MRIYFIRHGESEGNIDKSKYFEKLDCDIELTEKGKNQAEEVGFKLFQMLKDASCEFYHSPYLRTIQTSDIILEKVKHKSQESPLLREREWGGLRDIVEMGNKSEHHFNFYYRPDSGESFADCYQRVVLFFNSIWSKKKNNTIIVSHGEWISMAMMYLLKREVKDFQKYKNPKNCQLFCLESLDKGKNWNIIEGELIERNR